MGKAIRVKEKAEENYFKDQIESNKLFKRTDIHFHVKEIYLNEKIDAFLGGYVDQYSIL
jgi:hypothetical protein